MDYIAKPFKREEVLSWVQTHLKTEQLIQDKESLDKKPQDQKNELVETQNKYQIIFEKLSDEVLSLDTEGKILRYNATFSSLL